MDPSPWPFLSAMSLFSVPVSLIVWLWEGPFYPVVVSLMLVLIPVYSWVEDVITEGTFCGMHTSHVSSCLATATLLFIFSEVMFFFSFFWAWAHSAWVPSIYLGRQWPPKGVKPIHLFGVPLFNLVSLVWSSGTLNVANGCLRIGNRGGVLGFMFFTLVLGIMFEYAQMYEYYRSSFCISDGVYGSTFFMLTGFHGVHVMGGGLFLVFNWWRMYEYHFHTGFNVGWVAGVWYWHFVDAVWVVLWFTIYGWGGSGYFVYFMWPPIYPHTGVFVN